MLGLSDAVQPLEDKKSHISCQFMLHVIVINKSGYPNYFTYRHNILSIIEHIPHATVNDEGRTMHFPMTEEFVSPRFIASCTPWRTSQRISFWLALMNDNLCASIIVYPWKKKRRKAKWNKWMNQWRTTYI